MDEKVILGKLIFFSVAMVLLFAYTVYCLWRTEQKLKKANDELLALKSEDYNFKKIAKLIKLGDRLHYRRPHNSLKFGIDWVEDQLKSIQETK